MSPDSLPNNLCGIVTTPRRALQIQLDLRSSRYVDVFDALNPLQPFTWPYLRWLWRCREKYPEFEGFAMILSIPMMSLHLQLDLPSDQYLEVFDAHNPLVEWVGATLHRSRDRTVDIEIYLLNPFAQALRFLRSTPAFTPLLLILLYCLQLALLLLSFPLGLFSLVLFSSVLPPPHMR